MSGRFCRLEPLDPVRHSAALFEADSLDSGGANWTYLPHDQPADRTSYEAYIAQIAASTDPLFYAIVDLDTEEAVGIASLMRIDQANGVIEVGNIRYSPRLQRTAAATEAMFLLMCRVFDELGYRRYEWKCDALNAPSRNAALRLGFSYEGLFRQAVIYKGRNRDTTWFSIIDAEWPALKSAYETWLAPDNFDDQGKQRARLPDLIEKARQA